MRRIRNDCRQYLTHNSLYISEDEQRAWFQSTYLTELSRGTFRAFLARYDEPCGYGIVRTQDGRAWLTGGLLPQHRGRGLGRDLFLFLRDYALLTYGNAWLDVFRSNGRALALYTSIGFVISEETDQLCVMGYR